MDDLVALGVLIVGVTAVVETSSIDAPRPGLELALLAARDAGSVLVAPTRCRLLRHRTYDGTHDTERPTVGEYRFLRHLAAGVPLASILDPDASPSLDSRGNSMT